MHPLRNCRKLGSDCFENQACMHGEKEDLAMNV